MTVQYKLQHDIAGYNGYGLQFSDLKYSVTLTASTNTTQAVPLSGAIGAPLNTINKYLAVINVTSGDVVWCANNATAAIPAGDTFAATTSDMINGGEYYAREVKAGDVLHFITAATGASVSILFYALPAN
jgi:hypothetical protein